LQGAQLKDAVILLSGHADARGGDDYNQRLSERRAEAVKKYLTDKHRIPTENLTTAGFSKRELRTRPIGSPLKIAAFRSSTWSRRWRPIARREKWLVYPGVADQGARDDQPDGDKGI
jgi:hypothetical protein